MQALEVIHENNDFIVVNKKAGLISEKSPFEDITVESQVLKLLLEKKRKAFIGVIHRLDRVTSGVLIFAKKKGVLVAFNKLFSEREIQKTYLAIVQNKPQKDSAVLTNYLVKNTLDKRANIELTASKEAKESILSYRIIATNKFGYLLEVKPKTGRFHQIRAQLAHIGSPIIGDEKYGSNKEYQPLSVCLHAWKLSYKSLDSNKEIHWEATVPKNEFWDFNLPQNRKV